MYTIIPRIIIYIWHYLATSTLTKRQYYTVYSAYNPNELLTYYYYYYYCCKLCYFISKQLNRFYDHIPYTVHKVYGLTWYTYSCHNVVILLHDQTYISYNRCLLFVLLRYIYDMHLGRIITTDGYFLQRVSPNLFFFMVDLHRINKRLKYYY